MAEQIVYVQNPLGEAKAIMLELLDLGFQLKAVVPGELGNVLWLQRNFDARPAFFGSTKKWKEAHNA